MRRYSLISVSIVAFLSALFAFPTFSQEAQAPAEEEASQPEELSIYGEVQNVNAVSNSLTVQYYDYDSDEEKSAEVILDKDATLEGASTLNDIKQGDWVDVTYIVSEGKNISKYIIVEKEEELVPEAALEGEVPQETPAKE